MKSNINIVLIGMPAAGKSTVGVLLAKSCLKDFIDTDLIIQRKYDCTLSEIIEKEGTEAFLKKENDVICSLKCFSSVVATGGSAVYGEQAMLHLRENGVVVYLKLSLKEITKRIGNIKTRGVAMKNGTDLLELYKEREPLYNKYADVIIDCENLTAEQAVDEILEKLRAYSISN